MTENTKTIRTWAIIASALFLLSSFSTCWFWSKYRNLAEENTGQGQRIESLMAEKEQLDRQLDSLNAAYNFVRLENDSLQGAVARSEHIVVEKLSQLEQLRKKNTRDIKELRAQVAALQQAKTELETVVTLLRTENEQLKAENERLAGENEQLRGQNTELGQQVSELSQKLEDQIRKTHSAKFKASAFRVEVERRGEKLTTKARKVRNLTVSFDLADVPEAFQGPQKLYLVIADDRGAPIASANPIKATVDAPSGAVQIVAQQAKAVALGPTQRLSFSYKLDEKLKKGSYVAAIYCDKGLLGVSSFRLM
ncbi:MAG: hypothetical protein JNL02_14545 [Saprospiraceae bacterium]|nr:hypothetical protein [Saprospiraceae bacterium]